jgi:hypothetical protein
MRSITPINCPLGTEIRTTARGALGLSSTVCHSPSGPVAPSAGANDSGKARPASVRKPQCPILERLPAESLVRDLGPLPSRCARHGLLASRFLRKASRFRECELELVQWIAGQGLPAARASLGVRPVISLNALLKVPSDR